MNRVRGLLAEFGVWLARSPEALMRALPRLMEDESIPHRIRPLLMSAQSEIRRLDERIESCTREIQAHATQSDEAQRIEALIGIGSITSIAVVATVPNARDFKNGRQMGRWRPGSALFPNSLALVARLHWAASANAATHNGRRYAAHP